MKSVNYSPRGHASTSGRQRKKNIEEEMERAQETTRNTNPIIEVQGVTKRYANHLAIDAVSFRYREELLTWDQWCRKNDAYSYDQSDHSPDNGTYSLMDVHQKMMWADWISSGRAWTLQKMK